MKNKKSVTESAETVARTRSTSGIILKIFLALVLIVIVAYFGFTSTVREGNCAVILRFGAPRAEVTEPGLYFKLPWPFETVYTYDSRTQYLESKSLETTTSDNRNIIVQSYALWSVSDPLTFHNTIGSADKAQTYIKDQISSATNSVMGSYALTGLVSLDAEQIKIDEIQQRIYEMVKATCEASYGVTVYDVSILRISLPDTNLENVFEQMRADRQKDIDTIIANAQAEAQKITNDADEEAEKIVSEAEISAAEITKKTEAEVAKIYAEAQSANMELYTFLKELDTIIASVSSDTVLVVTADTYPFNVLLNYGENLADEDSVITDLQYILEKLYVDDPTAYSDFVDAVYALIVETKGTKSADEVKAQILYRLDTMKNDSSARTAFAEEVERVLSYTVTESDDSVITDLKDLLLKLKGTDATAYDTLVAEIRAMLVS